MDCPGFIQNSMQVGAGGVALIAVFIDPVSGLPIDISAASSLGIKIGYPDGTSADFTASFVTNGTDGQIQYVTQPADTFEAGVHSIQGKCVLNAEENFTAVGQFYVKANVDNN